MVDFPKLIKGTALCIGGTIPFAISRYVPEKLKVVPYVAGAGLEAWGLWNIYEGFVGKEGWGSADVPAKDIRGLVNLYWYYPSVWMQEIPCDSLPLLWQAEVRWTTKPEINNHIPEGYGSIMAYAFAMLYDYTANEAWKLAIYPGTWPFPDEYVGEIVLYYPSDPSILPFKWFVPNGKIPGIDKFWLCGRKNHEFIIKFLITDHLEYPHEDWWWGTPNESLEEHLIAEATGAFKIV